MRQKRWDWYLDDFTARLKPKAKRILMNTRWHDEDVAGRVMEQIEPGMSGAVISIPAIAEATMILWGASPANICGTSRWVQLRGLPARSAA